MNELSSSQPQQASAINALLDPETFAHMGKVAAVLVDSGMLPAHLKGVLKDGKMVKTHDREKQLAIAFVVLNAAHLFKAEPFAFAQETFQVHGKLDFNGKVYAGLANSRASLVRPLRYEFIGDGKDKRCICSGLIRGEAEPRTIQTPTFDHCSKDPKGHIRPAWKGCDPDQQLSYFAARTWVRRHCPQVLLGLASDADDFDEPIGEEATVIEVETKKGCKLLDKPANVVIHLDAIARATTIEELTAVRAQIDNDSELTGAGRAEVLHEGRQKYEELTRDMSEPEWVSKVADCEAILHESEDPAAIEQAWNEIDLISELPPMENKRLGELFNERMREFAPPSELVQE